MMDILRRQRCIARLICLAADEPDGNSESGSLVTRVLDYGSWLGLSTEELKKVLDLKISDLLDHPMQT